MLHHDIAAVNARLTADCRKHGPGLLLPVGSVNPTLPDWEEDLRRCDEEHHMHAIRIHPNYHGYELDSDVCSQLLGQVSQRNMVVQIAMKMEDVRTHHPLMRVPTVDPVPLERLLAKHPELRVVVLNNGTVLRPAAAAQLARLGHVYFEISHAEQIGALEKWLRDIPLERILFGSHFPFFHLEATLLKFRESQIGGLATSAIQKTNASRLAAYGRRPRPWRSRTRRPAW